MLQLCNEKLRARHAAPRATTNVDVSPVASARLFHIDPQQPSSYRMQTKANMSRPSVVSKRQVQPMAFLGNLFGGTTKQSKATVRQQRKEELLELIEPLQRGLKATEEDKAAVESLVQQLEKINPTPNPLESPYLNGRWRLVYTTSDSILGTKKLPFLRPSGPIYQLLDGPNLKAANRETAPLFNQVTAELTPMSANKVAVQFKTFKIAGLIPISAPPSARGELAVTYLDEDMRISRGDKGNLFVLLMDDPDDRP